MTSYYFQIFVKVGLVSPPPPLGETKVKSVASDSHLEDMHSSREATDTALDRSRFQSLTVIRLSR